MKGSCSLQLLANIIYISQIAFSQLSKQSTFQCIQPCKQCTGLYSISGFYRFTFGLRVDSATTRRTGLTVAISGFARALGGIIVPLRVLTVPLRVVIIRLMALTVPLMAFTVSLKALTSALGFTGRF